MSVVLDSSVTLAWVYAGEITEPVRHVIDLVSENRAWLPGLGRLEVANIPETGVGPRPHGAAYLKLALRRGRRTAGRANPDGMPPARAAFVH